MNQSSTIHEGRNIKRFREMPGVKQEALAAELGDDWNLKNVSLLEQKQTVDSIILDQVSAALKIPVGAFRNFDEEQAVNIISSTFHDSAIANRFSEGAQANFNCTFNPLDKLIEAYDEISRLNAELIRSKVSR